MIRQVNWIADSKSGSGKSTLAKWMIENLGFMKIEKQAIRDQDFAYSYSGEPGVVFDLPMQTNMEMVNYGLFEKINNGCVFSSKYQSKPLYFPRPHVFVFSNSVPIREKLSESRWNVICI